MDIEFCKKLAALEAIKHVKNHMLLGLGTGSTVFYFIEALIKKAQEGLNVRCVASSHQSELLGKKGGLVFADVQQIETIDLTVDGADAIDSKSRMIKGGGGALLREKILASASENVIIIVDETKVVSTLEKQKVPIEVLPFGAKLTQAAIMQLGFSGQWRKERSGSFYKTDNGNYIFDILYTPSKDSIEHDDLLLKNIPGVMETGFFLNVADKVYIGNHNGHVRTLNF